MTMGGSASHHAEREAVDFSTSLLWFHLGRSPPAVLASGEDEVDGVETDRAAVTTLTAAQDSDQPSATRVSSKESTTTGDRKAPSRPTSFLVESIKDTNVTKKGLVEALFNNKMHYKEDVNELRPCDDKREFGDLALLHRLVVAPYTHQIDLLLSLITFSGADIDHRTSNGHTAFQLAVVLGNVRVVQLLAALGADVTLPPYYKCPPPTRTNKRIRPLLCRRYLPTDLEYNSSCWARDNYGVCNNFVSDPTPLSPPRTSITTDNDMNSFLREVGARATLNGRCSVVTTRSQSTTSPCGEHKGAACSCSSTNSSSPYPQITRERKPTSRELRKSTTELSKPPQTIEPQQHLLLPVGPQDSAPAYEPQLSSAVLLREPISRVAPLLFQIPCDRECTGGEALEVVRQLREEASRGRRRNGARVLCLSGGGLRGLVELEMLRQIQQVLQENNQTITSFFDYIVATSTGAIIALAMVYGGMSVGDVLKLYLTIKNEVFTPKKRFKKGNTAKLEGYLKFWLKDYRMSDKSHPKVLVSAVLRESTPVKLHWFNNFLTGRKSKDYVWKVARYTSAAPFYFSPRDNYLDGGLLANNPSLHALSTIQDHLRSEGTGTGVSLLVSVGAGLNPPKAYKGMEISNILEYILKHGRFLQFMVDVAVEGHAEACEETCRSMCREQGIGYVRLSPSLGSEVDSGETDDEKLMDMMWTTRKYMANSGHRHLNILRDLIVIP